MHVTIREAALEDAAVINQLSEQLGYTSTLAQTAACLEAIMASKAHRALVAVAGGEVVGWIHGCYTLRLESEPSVEIGGLVIHHKARGEGVGTKLLQEMIKWGQQISVAKIRVRTNTARLQAHQFYQRTGHTETKEQKVYDLLL